MALGIVMLLTACDGGGGVTANNQYCAEPGCGYTPTPPHSRFDWTFVGQGEVTRTTGGCRVRMPKVEIEETAGYGGVLQGSVARISYYDTVGTFHGRVEEYLAPGAVEAQLGVIRYEGKAKRTVELVFELPIDPRPHDGLQFVDWLINFQDDTMTVLDQSRIEIAVPPARFDLGPGL